MFRLSLDAHSMVDSFFKPQIGAHQKLFHEIKFLNYSRTIINININYNDTPTRVGFDNTFCTSFETCQYNFFEFISNSSDFLHTKLWIIQKGLSLGKNMKIIDLICYTYSFFNISLIMTILNKYHNHVIFIQIIKINLIENTLFRHPP